MLIADGGGGSRPTVVPTVNPATTQRPASTNNTTQSDAAARARELQRQIEALLERIREMQRQAAEARRRAIEAQQKAEIARKAAEAAREKANKTKLGVDEDAAKKAEQNYKLEDARLKKAAADVQVKDKEIALAKAQVAQKKEQKKSADGKASPEADKKVSDAQGELDDAKRTGKLSNDYLDYQEKETKAQAAEAKVKELTPVAGRPQSTVTQAEWDKLTAAQNDAKTLRKDANDAKTTFMNDVGAEAPIEFYGPQTTQTGQPLAQVPGGQNLANDPLHSPLLQFLQVTPPLGSSPSSTLLYPTLGPKVTPDVTKTLSGIADGKTVDQIARDRGVSVDDIVNEAKAAGVTLESGEPKGDTQATTVKRGDATLVYTRNTKDNSLSVKATFADPQKPGSTKTIEATRDKDGRFIQKLTDPKTGDTTTHILDPNTGTRTDIVEKKDGSKVETTTDLTGATVLRPVKAGEDYLDVAKAAGLEPEQLLALNPDIDYGKPLKEGQQMVVSGVRTTTVTTKKDGTKLEVTTEADGTRKAVFVTSSGRRIVLMGSGEPDDQSEKIRKGLFEQKKSVADVAKELGISEEDLLKALPPGTVTETTSPTNGALKTRTIYDPVSNRVLVETIDLRRDTRHTELIDDKTTFKVRQLDPKTGQYVMKEVAGAVGYMQKLADDRLAVVADYDQQIRDLDQTIRFNKRMREPVDDLEQKRQDLVSKRNAAQGEADVAQAQATEALVKRQQVQIDDMAANAYQRQFVARPGSKEQKEATQDLNDVLALAEKIDLLTFASHNDVLFAKAAADKQQKADNKLRADENLQTEFQKWKKDVWMWEGIPKDTADKMKAKGERPLQRTFASVEQEDKAAWEAFVDQQKDLDKYGDKNLPPQYQAARNAWKLRNAASDASLQSDNRYLDALTNKGGTDKKVVQADINQLLEKKADWMKAHPDDFSENFTGQKELDKLNGDLTKLEVDGLLNGKDKSYNEYLLTLSASDRADPEALKKATDKYLEDHQEDNEKVDQKINDLVMAATRNRATVSEDYIAQWKLRNPKQWAQYEALGENTGMTSVRAAEHRAELKQELLASTPQFQQLKSAFEMKDNALRDLLKVGDDDITRVQQDLDGINKSIEGHTWVRDAWGGMFGDASDESHDYTQGKLDEVKRLRQQLANGDITLAEFTKREDELMDGYGLKSIDLSQDLKDSDGTWSVVDDAVRMTVSAAAGIAATIASGGNIAVGFAVGAGVNALWDTAGDAVSALQGRDIYADGHSSIFSLGARAVTGNASWNDVKFTLKDDAIDLASSAVSATGVGAGIRTSAAVSARVIAKGGLVAGTTNTLKLGGRIKVGMAAGVVGQGVDGAGRVGVEIMHVGLDGKLGTAEGDQRIRGTAISSLAGLGTSWLTGGASGAIPMNKVFGVGLGAQALNDWGGSVATSSIISKLNEGNWSLNRGEWVAASVQAIPGTMTNVAFHPSFAGLRSKPAATRPTGAGFTPEGIPLEPTSVSGVPSYKDLAAPRKIDPLIQQHEQSATDPSVPRLQPTNDEIAVTKWLMEDPVAGSGTLFVLSKLGPNDTIYGANGGLRARGSDTFKTFKEASDAAAQRGGGWVHRVQPNTDMRPVYARRRVDANEVVGAVHVNAAGQHLPYGIPNMTHAKDLAGASGRPSWLGEVKGRTDTVKGWVHKVSSPTRGLLGVASVQGGAIASKMFGSGWVYDNITGGAYAAWVNQTRGLGTRAAYFTGKRGLENALAMANRGETAEALAQVEIVASRPLRRGLSPDEIANKKQDALDQIGEFGNANHRFRQGLRDAGLPADVQAKVMEDFPTTLFTEAEGKVHGQQTLKTMADGTLVDQAFAELGLPKVPKKLDSTTKRLQAVDAYRTQQEGGTLTTAQQNRLKAFNKLSPEARDKLFAAREGELGYQKVKEMVEDPKKKLINMKDVQSALGSTMHMGSPVGQAFKFGALAFAVNSGMSGTYNFAKHIFSSSSEGGLLKGLALSGEVVGNVPNIGIQWNYLTGLLRRTKFSAIGTDAQPPIADVNKYIDKRLKRMTNVRDGITSFGDLKVKSWSDARALPGKLRIGWGTLEAVLPKKYIANSRLRASADETNNVPGSDRVISLGKHIVNRRAEAEKRVKTLTDAKTNGTEPVLRDTAKTESEAAAKSMNTAGDFMAIPSMFRYSMMGVMLVTTGHPVLAGITMFHGIVSNGGWLRSQQGKGVIQPLGHTLTEKLTGMGVKEKYLTMRLAPTGLDTGSGLFFVGKRLGRAYNSLVDVVPDSWGKGLASAAKKAPWVGGKVKSDNLVDSMKLGLSAEDAANRRRKRLLLTGATAPTLNLLVALLADKKPEDKPIGQGLDSPLMPSTVTSGRNTVANEALTQLFNLDPSFDNTAVAGAASDIGQHPEALVDDWRVQLGPQGATA
jgi:hypothetical protein